MWKLLAPFRFLYKLYFGIIFFATMVLLYPLMLFFLIRKEWHDGLFYVRVVWSWILGILSLTLVMRKREAPLPKGAFVICANHQSYFDIVFMYSAITRPYRFIGKKELVKWPLFGYLFSRYDIPVDRTNRRAAVRSLIDAGESLKKGKSIAIFPEGTIPDDAPKLLPFKNGGFSLAIKNQVPIVPVTIVDHWKRLSDPGDLFGRASPGRARIIIHEAIPTEGMTDEDLIPLRDRVFNVIQETLKQHGNHG